MKLSIAFAAKRCSKKSSKSTKLLRDRKAEMAHNLVIAEQLLAAARLPCYENIVPERSKQRKDPEGWCSDRCDHLLCCILPR